MRHDHDFTIDCLNPIPAAVSSEAGPDGASSIVPTVGLAPRTRKAASRKLCFVEDGPQSFEAAVAYIYGGEGTSPRRVWSNDIESGNTVDISEDVARAVARQAAQDGNYHFFWAREFVEMHGVDWPEERDAFSAAADAAHDRRNEALEGAL